MTEPEPSVTPSRPSREDLEKAIALGRRFPVHDKVSDFNVKARTFYERHGFVVVAPLPGLVREDRTELLMRKQLL